MSKTKKEYKGEEYTAKDRKKYKDKKHFGETSGSHSRTEDNIDHKKGVRRTNETPIKGKDFIKYGYPSEMRDGKVIKNLQKERDAKEQIEEINEESDDFWCKCEEDTKAIYVEDGVSEVCDKHHWVCKECGKVKQVG